MSSCCADTCVVGVTGGIYCWLGIAPSTDDGWEAPGIPSPSVWPGCRPWPWAFPS